MRAATIAAVVLIAGVAAAAPIVQETFSADDGGFALGGSGHGGFVYQADVDGTGEAGVEITAAGSATPFVDIYTADTPGGTLDFFGNYRTGADVNGDPVGPPVLGVSFDFYIDPLNGVVDGEVPSYLNIYFTGDVNSWRWTIPQASMISGGWNTYGANFDTDSYSTGFGSWDMIGGAEVDGTWQTDIANISSIGLELGYLIDGSAQTYGLKNFTLLDEAFLVPEPETYLVLGMALLSIAVVFRKRISDSVAEARAALMA